MLVFWPIQIEKVLALARLKTALGFVDHVNPAATPHDATISMPVLQRFDRAADFHVTGPLIQGVYRKPRHIRK